MIRGPKKCVSIMLPLELYERVKVQAEKKDHTFSAYVRQVLRRYLWHAENAPETLVDEWKIL